MQKLRGSGSTFSTSGKHWKPFRHNPKITRRNARLHRLQRKGLTPTKHELVAMSEAAVAGRPIPQRRPDTD
jgi:hypothetical protein